MTTGTWRLQAPSRAVAAMAMALLVAPLAASAASGGTISFAGAITAPPLAVTEGPASSGARAATAGPQAGRQGQGVTLTFNSAPGVASGADVALQMIGTTQSRDAIAVRFVDSSGRVAAARDGHYRVGRDGGVLSLSPKRSGADTPVTVVVSYD
jgi:hypothetical protein